MLCMLRGLRPKHRTCLPSAASPLVQKQKSGFETPQSNGFTLSQTQRLLLLRLIFFPESLSKLWCLSKGIKHTFEQIFSRVSSSVHLQPFVKMSKQKQHFLSIVTFRHVKIFIWHDDKSNKHGARYVIIAVINNYQCKDNNMSRFL